MKIKQVIVTLISFLVNVSCIQHVPELQTWKIIRYTSFVGFQYVGFSPAFSNRPQVILQWDYLELPGGSNNYSLIPTSISISGFTYTATCSTPITQFSFFWQATLDDNIFVQSQSVMQTINSNIVTLTFNFLQTLTYIPNAAFLLTGMTQTQTITPDSYGYSIYLGAVTQIDFQVIVNIPNGYTVTKFNFSLLYGSPQYLLTGYKGISSLGTQVIMTVPGTTKRVGLSITGIQGSANIRIHITRPDTGIITSNTWQGEEQKKSLISELLMLIINYNLLFSQWMIIIPSPDMKIEKNMVGYVTTLIVMIITQ